MAASSINFKPTFGTIAGIAESGTGQPDFITKADLPQQLTNRLIRLAAFKNPEFYKAQAMRLPVWSKPRIIGCAENFPQHIGLPRGYLDDLLELLKENDIRAEIQDERSIGHKVIVQFDSELCQQTV